MKIEHKLGPAWAQHVAEVRQQIANTERENWIMKGQIAHNEREIQAMRNHLQTLLGVIETAEKLPASKTPYALSADGSALVGEIEAPKDGAV